MTTTGILLAIACGVIVALLILILVNHERASARPMTGIGYIGIGLGALFLIAGMPSGNAFACIPGAFFIAACFCFARRERPAPPKKSGEIEM